MIWCGFPDRSCQAIRAVNENNSVGADVMASAHEHPPSAVRAEMYCEVNAGKSPVVRDLDGLAKQVFGYER